MDLVAIEDILPDSIELKLGKIGDFLSKNAGKIAIVGGLALGGYALYKYGELKGRRAERKAQAQSKPAPTQPAPTQPEPTQPEPEYTGTTQPAPKYTGTTQLGTKQQISFNWITIIIVLGLLLAIGAGIWMFLRRRK